MRLPAFTQPLLLLAGIGVGVCSSVIPYVTDQLALARLSRATFALMLALLPAFASVIGVIVLRQIPTPIEVAGVALIIGGVALRREHSIKEIIRRKDVLQIGCLGGIETGSRAGEQANHRCQRHGEDHHEQRHRRELEPAGAHSSSGELRLKEHIGNRDHGAINDEDERQRRASSLAD